MGFAVVLHCANACAELIVRSASEGDDDFMARVVGPATELAQRVVRSTELAGGRLTLIGFVYVGDGVEGEPNPTEANSLVGHLLVEMSPGRYEHVRFLSCEEEGGPPELLAVFFARTAKGSGRDLAVLCMWEARGQIVNGASYGARFYRLKERGSTVVAESVTDLDKQFDTSDVVERDKRGKWVHGSHAKFKTVADVKRLLSKMGIKQ